MNTVAMTADSILNLFSYKALIPTLINILFIHIVLYLLSNCYMVSQKWKIITTCQNWKFDFHHFLHRIIHFCSPPEAIIFQTPFEIKSGEEEHGTYRYCQTMVYNNNNVKMDFPIFLWPLVCTKACWIPLKVSSVMTIMILNFWLAAQNRWSQLIVLVHLFLNKNVFYILQKKLPLIS